MEKSDKLMWAVIIFFLICLYVFGVHIIPLIQKFTSSSALLGG